MFHAQQRICRSGRDTGALLDDEVIRFSIECLDALSERDVKAIIVACNTSWVREAISSRRPVTSDSSVLVPTTSRSAGVRVPSQTGR